MSGQTIVRGETVLDCSPFDPEGINACIAAVRAAVETEHGAGRWEASHDPFGWNRKAAVPDGEGGETLQTVSSPANLLSWTYYPNGGPSE